MLIVAYLIFLAACALLFFLFGVAMAVGGWLADRSESHHKRAAKLGLAS